MKFAVLKPRLQNLINNKIFDSFFVFLKHRCGIRLEIQAIFRLCVPKMVQKSNNFIGFVSTDKNPLWQCRSVGIPYPNPSYEFLTELKCLNRYWFVKKKKKKWYTILRRKIAWIYNWVQGWNSEWFGRIPLGLPKICSDLCHKRLYASWRSEDFTGHVARMKVGLVHSQFLNITPNERRIQDGQWKRRWLTPVMACWKRAAYNRTIMLHCNM